MYHQPHSGMVRPLAESTQASLLQHCLSRHAARVTHLRVAVGGEMGGRGNLSLHSEKPKALGSPTLLVPSPRETPAVHCASPFSLFQGPRGPDGSAGEQGPRGLKVRTPMA